MNVILGFGAMQLKMPAITPYVEPVAEEEEEDPDEDWSQEVAYVASTFGPPP